MSLSNVSEPIPNVKSDLPARTAQERAILVAGFVKAFGEILERPTDPRLVGWSHRLLEEFAPQESWLGAPFHRSSSQGLPGLWKAIRAVILLLLRAGNAIEWCSEKARALFGIVGRRSYRPDISSKVERDGPSVNS